MFSIMIFNSFEPFYLKLMPDKDKYEALKKVNGLEVGKEQSYSDIIPIIKKIMSLNDLSVQNSVILTLKHFIKPIQNLKECEHSYIQVLQLYNLNLKNRFLKKLYKSIKKENTLELLELYCFILQ